MMNAQTLKEKIMSGQITDDELLEMLSKAKRHRNSGSTFKNILNGFIQGYTVPSLWKLILESLLILVIVIGTIVLSYANKMNDTTTAVILASVLGFLFGKIK